MIRAAVLLLTFQVGALAQAAPSASRETRISSVQGQSPERVLERAVQAWANRLEEVSAALASSPRKTIHLAGTVFGQSLIPKAQATLARGRFCTRISHSPSGVLHLVFLDQGKEVTEKIPGVPRSALIESVSAVRQYIARDPKRLAKPDAFFVRYGELLGDVRQYHSTRTPADARSILAHGFNYEGGNGGHAGHGLYAVSRPYIGVARAFGSSAILEIPVLPQAKVLDVHQGMGSVFPLARDDAGQRRLYRILDADVVRYPYYANTRSDHAYLIRRPSVTRTLRLHK